MEQDSQPVTRRGGVALWLIVFAVTLAVFYGLDHAVMAMQGLPLNFDLTPVR